MVVDVTLTGVKRRAHLYIVPAFGLHNVVREGLAPQPNFRLKDMAIYHLNAKIISRSKGRTVVGASAYRAGVKLKDDRTGEVYDYTRKKVYGSEIIAPADSPEWVHDRTRLWNEVEHAEKRKDAQVAREVEIAIPAELNQDDRKTVVRSFVQEQFVNKGMVADIAFHDQKGDNPHAHILLTTRTITQTGFGQKNRDWNKEELLMTWRKEWSIAANKALELAGISARIDHRSLEAQGIEREPQIHLGPHVAQMEEKGIRTDRGSKYLEIAARNAKLEQHQRKAMYERDGQNTESKEWGRDRTGDRAISSSPGSSERRFEAENGGTSRHWNIDQRQHGGLLHETEQSNRERIERSPEDSQAIQRGLGGTEKNDEGLHSQIVALSNSGEPNEWGGSRDRIMALAEPIKADRAEREALERSSNDLHQPGPGQKTSIQTTNELGRTASARNQIQDRRTTHAVEHHLKAMGCQRFEIGIREQSTGRMINKEWTAKQVKENVAWLKRLNAQGNDIYIRPSKEEHNGLILVDDLKKESLTRMKEAGHRPALIVETSPNNYQAWVKVPASNDEIKKETAKELATMYGGDPGSVDARHYGRLAGFTNQKEKYRNAFNQQPYVLARDTNGKEATKAHELIQQATQRIQEREAKLEITKRLEALKTAGERQYAHSGVIDAYRREAWKMASQYKQDRDWSRIDYAVTRNLALSTRFTREELETAIKEASPLVQERHKNTSDYAKRTVEAVIQRVPEAAKAIAKAEHGLEIEVKLTRSLGRSR